MKRKQRQTDHDALYILCAIIIIIGFIIYLAKALIIPVLLLSIILFVIGNFLENENMKIFGICGIVLTIILLIIGYLFGDSEIGIMCQDAFKNFYNATLK